MSLITADGFLALVRAWRSSNIKVHPVGPSPGIEGILSGARVVCTDGVHTTVSFIISTPEDHYYGESVIQLETLQEICETTEGVEIWFKHPQHDFLKITLSLSTDEAREM
jgi:hypothetical protein